MEELKVHNWHVTFLEFKNNENATETAKKICSVYCQDVISKCQVQNWLSKFYSGDMMLRDEFRAGLLSDHNQDALRELLECNMSKSTWELALDLNISQSTICHYLKKIGKVSNLGVWLPHTLRRIRKIAYP